MYLPLYLLKTVVYNLASQTLNLVVRVEIRDQLEGKTRKVKVKVQRDGNRNRNQCLQSNDDNLNFRARRDRNLLLFFLILPTCSSFISTFSWLAKATNQPHIALFVAEKTQATFTISPHHTHTHTFLVLPFPFLFQNLGYFWGWLYYGSEFRFSGVKKGRGAGRIDGECKWEWIIFFSYMAQLLTLNGRQFQFQ